MTCSSLEILALGASKFKSRVFQHWKELQTSLFYIFGSPDKLGLPKIKQQFRNTIRKIKYIAYFCHHSFRFLRKIIPNNFV